MYDDQKKTYQKLPPTRQNSRRNTRDSRQLAKSRLVCGEHDLLVLHIIDG